MGAWNELSEQAVEASFKRHLDKDMDRTVLGNMGQMQVNETRLDGGS